MNNDIEQILFTEQQLADKTEELAQRLDRDYKNKDFLMVTVLKGGFMFAADLMRKMKSHVNINFIAVSSYGTAAKSSGAVKILKDMDSDVNGKDVIIVEDIVDTGLTLAYLKHLIYSRGAKSVKICTIMNKVAHRKVDIDIDYIGFEVPDEFLVGYGLDYAEKYRNLPYVGILKKEVYS